MEILKHNILKIFVLILMVLIILLPSLIFILTNSVVVFISVLIALYVINGYMTSNAIDLKDGFKDFLILSISITMINILFLASFVKTVYIKEKNGIYIVYTIIDKTIYKEKINIKNSKKIICKKEDNDV